MGALKALGALGMVALAAPALAGDIQADSTGRPAGRAGLPHGEKTGEGSRPAARPAGDAVARWRALTAEAASRFAIPSAWIEHVMRAESGGQTVWKGTPITSRAGAMGLMQLMPRTWAAMREALNLGNNPHDPHDNILAGTAYLRLMYERFGYPGLFAAYNAGPGRYRAYLASGRALPAETRNYLAKVAGRQAAGNPAALPVTVDAMTGSSGATGRSSVIFRLDTSPRPGLFVTLQGGAMAGGDKDSPALPSSSPVPFPSSSSAMNSLFAVRNSR